MSDALARRFLADLCLHHFFGRELGGALLHHSHAVALCRLCARRGPRLPRDEPVLLILFL